MIVIPPATPLVRTSVHLPASKSISNRLLIIRQLSGGTLAIRNLSDAGDTVLLKELLAMVNASARCRTPQTIDCRDAGTVFRFLTALLAVTPGNWFLTGSGRMKQRPVGVLADALMESGADIRYTGEKGFPPLAIRGGTIKGGNSVSAPGDVSSQFISALMLIAPSLPGGLNIRITGRAVSAPYIAMTAGIMQQCGADVTVASDLVRVAGKPYTPPVDGLSVEADWSSAAFWYEVVALSDETEVILPGLSFNSLQGDAIAAGIFEKLGVGTTETAEGILLKKYRIRSDESFIQDFTSCPDLAQAVAVTCAGLNIPARLTGLSGLRIKETDRLSALVSELTKTGYRVHAEKGSDLVIAGNQPVSGDDKIVIHTYNDHRMAMAFAPLAFKTGKIGIDNPAVVRKSYPGFWNDLKSAGFRFENFCWE